MKKVINLLILGLIATGFSSCLKDDSIIGPDAPGATKNIVEFLNPDFIGSGTSSTYALYVKSFDIAASATTVVQVSYSGADVAPEDIRVKVGLDPAALAKYNTENAAHYTDMPTSLYSFSTTDLVIPKGQRVANLTITVKPDQFDFSASYALPLKIVSASTGVISGNFGTIILALAAKNKYDGIYTPQAGSFVQRYSSPTTPTVGDALNGSTASNPDLTFTTISANTVQIGNLRWAGGTSNVAGIDNLQATVDPATNLVTMKAIGNATLAIIPGSINKYDPATKTFTLNFDWNQTGSKRVYSLVAKYKGTR
ncbi:BT_3987 domain-containing protein [Pedobacter sp. GSP4]|uniref:BT_3987 domain-containing protein n=1 Tax=Pedobacter sp. GSP4 TaxID=3453716 RepID=UPI003EEAC481